MEVHSQWRTIVLSVLTSINYPPVNRLQNAKGKWDCRQVEDAFRPLWGCTFTAAEHGAEPKSLTFTTAHLTCLISINTPLCDKHVYLLTANITQSDSTRCCFSNEDLSFYQGRSCPSVKNMPLLYRHQKAFCAKKRSQIICSKHSTRPYFSIRVFFLWERKMLVKKKTKSKCPSSYFFQSRHIKIQSPLWRQLWSAHSSGRIQYDHGLFNSCRVHHY